MRSSTRVVLRAYGATVTIVQASMPTAVDRCLSEVPIGMLQPNVILPSLEVGTSLKDSSISVQSVNCGAVLLGRTAKTLRDHLSAVEVAAGVPGVCCVTSEIQSPDTLADKEIWRERTAQKSNAEYGAVDASRDVWITWMAKMRLLADRQTPALDINVDSRDGVAIYASPTKKQRADAETRGESPCH